VAPGSDHIEVAILYDGIGAPARGSPDRIALGIHDPLQHGGDGGVVLSDNIHSSSLLGGARCTAQIQV
jgi:hypothetical protein